MSIKFECTQLGKMLIFVPFEVHVVWKYTFGNFFITTCEL